jgi:hypothetical protein
MSSICTLTSLEVSIQNWSKETEMEKKRSQSTIESFEVFLFDRIYLI